MPLLLAKRLSHLLLLSVFLPSLAGCSYLAGRGNDLRDVLTIAVEDKGVHAGFQVLPLGMGLGYADGNGYGLRNGTAGKYSYSEFSLGVMGRKTFSAEERRLAKKNCDFVWIAPVFVRQEGQNETSSAGGPSRLGYSSLAVCPWNIEGTISLGVGLRLGLNLAELADFTLGWTGFDLLKDDPARIE